MASGVPGQPAVPDGASELARVLGGYADWIDRLPVVLYVAEIEHHVRLRYVSPQVEDLLGYPAADWLGDEARFVERIHPADRDRVVAVLREVPANVAVSAGEFRMVASDGRTVWLADRRVATQTGDAGVIVGMVTDISESRHIAQELAETEARFRDIVENVEAVFWIRNLAGDEVLYVSPAYEEAWGRPVASIYASAHAWLDAIHPDDRRRVMDAALGGRPDEYDAEYRIVRPDGTIRWIHDRAFPLRGGVDRAGLVAGMAEDVTNRHETEAALAEARERARAAFLNSPLGSAMVALAGAEARQVVEVNPAFCAMLGYPEMDIVGRDADSFIHADDLSERPDWRAMCAGQLDTYDTEQRLTRADGRVIQVRMRFSLVRGVEGNPTYAVIQAEDVTAAKRAEAQTAAVAELGQRALIAGGLEELMDEAVDAVRSTLDTRIVGVLEYVADQDAFVARALAGVDEERAAPARAPVGGPGHLRSAFETRQPAVVDDWLADPPFEPTGFVQELRARSTLSVPISGPRGTWGVLSTHSCEVRPFGPDEVSFAQAVANVLGAAIQRRLAEEETQYRALHDPLTELPNRTLFLDRLGHALDRAARTQRAVAVLFMDLDNFKVINDSLGHETGDRLLCEFAPRLTDALRPSDTVARFGGDEFVVLCEDIDNEEDVVHLAERVLAGLREPFTIGSHELFTSATIGLAIAREGDDADGLIRDADAAMYRAKAHGRGRYELFDQAMRERVSERLRTENALRRALADEALSLRFQPIVALDDRSIVGAETLLRWHDAKRGWIEPSRFIPIAEESGLIVAIGAWVLEQAMAAAVRWPEAPAGGGMPQLTVNLSTRQVTHPAFPGQLAGALERTGLPAERLSLEITESVLMEESGAPTDAIRALKELGIALVLDDFGTGYSSLSYLNRLPIDVLKLDRSFIAPLREPDHTTGAIVSGVVTMAEALGMTVVAEGVEEEAQVERLRALGCDYAQGFYFARPMAAEDLDVLLRAGTIPAAT